MRPAMMPRVDESPSRERENRGKEKPAEDALVEKKLGDEQDERPEKHQATAQPMRRPPGLGIFEGPRGADADKIVGTQIAEVISHDDEEG